MINKIYIDKGNSEIFYFNGERYIRIGTSNIIATATSEQAGIMKLYSTTGYNVDGTMTQKSITDELDLRFKASIKDNEELLIFTV